MCSVRKLLSSWAALEVFSTFRTPRAGQGGGCVPSEHVNGRLEAGQLMHPPWPWNQLDWPYQALRAGFHEAAPAQRAQDT